MNRVFLTPAEVAGVLGISRSKVYAMLAAKKMPSVSIEGVTRIPTAELRSWAREELGVELPERLTVAYLS